MNICVIATASRESGALSIYKLFISALKTEVGTDRYCIFVDPAMPRVEIEGVQYVAYDTRGAKRIAFDAYGFRRTVKKVGFVPDVIVSFQNVAVAYPRVRQIIYFHNLFPVSGTHWNPLRRDERTLFFYSSIYPHYIRHYLRRDMQIVVQANFIKDLFIDKFSFPPDNVSVLRPNVQLLPSDNASNYAFETDTFNFLYPVAPFKYKRHEFLVDVAERVKELSPEVSNRLKIHFTIKSEDMPALVGKIDEAGCKNMFVFHGNIEHSLLMNMLTASCGLLFSSVCETLGVPLLEAAACGLPVIVCDLPYAREVIGNYEGATFLDCMDVEAWALKIIKICNNKPRFKFYNNENKSSWNKFFKLIRDEK